MSWVGLLRHSDSQLLTSRHSQPKLIAEFEPAALGETGVELLNPTQGRDLDLIEALPWAFAVDQLGHTAFSAHTAAVSAAPGPSMELCG